MRYGACREIFAIKKLVRQPKINELPENNI